MKFWKFKKFLSWEIKKNSNSGNTKNLEFGIFRKFPIWKIKKKNYLKKLKKFQFEKLQKFAISQISNFEISRDFLIEKFSKFFNFQNFVIWTTIKIL